MFGKYVCLFLAPVFLLMGGACNRIQTTTQMQHCRMDDMRWAPRPQYAYMADNAMMHDASLADLHFVPHTAELSGTGIARLDRMAFMLDTYGGTLRYDTILTDEDLIQQRIEHVRDYLTTTECDLERIEVQAMRSGGRGLTAEDAAQAKEKAAQSSGQGTGGGISLGSLMQGGS